MTAQVRPCTGAVIAETPFPLALARYMRKAKVGSREMEVGNRLFFHAKSEFKIQVLLHLSELNNGGA